MPVLGIYVTIWFAALLLQYALHPNGLRRDLVDVRLWWDNREPLRREYTPGKRRRSL